METFMSINWRMDKQIVVCLQDGMQLSNGKEQTTKTNNINQSQKQILSKISQLEKNTYCIIITFIQISGTSKTNLF